MEKTKILTAGYLDILFDGRNKEYGAYELRTTYERRLWKALAITSGILVVLAIGYYLQATLFKANDKAVFRINEGVTIQDIKEEKKDIPPPVELPKKIEMPKVKTIDFVVPKVVADKDVVTPPPTQTEIDESKISNVNADGTRDIGIVTPPQVLDDRRGIVDVKKDDDNGGLPFLRVEIDAKYPGGDAAWRNFLEHNLRGEVPVENGATTGVYTVIIQFVVDKEGNVSDIKPLTGIGFGMEQEAMRVIRKSGKWTAAIQNGREVKAYRKQPITFKVEEQ